MFKPRNLNPGAGRLIIPAVATIGLLGIVVNSRRGSGEEKQSVGSRARDKRDSDGLGGAGIGGNMQSGGTEKGSFSGKGDAENSVQTTASSRDDLPSGGVGGGQGGGNSNTRAMEIRPSGEGPGSGSGSGSGQEKGSSKQAPQHNADSKTDYSNSQGNPSNSVLSASGSPMSASKTKQSASQTLQGVFQTGGANSGERGENQRKYHDTRVHSADPESPTKRAQMRSDS